MEHMESIYKKKSFRTYLNYREFFIQENNEYKSNQSVGIKSIRYICGLPEFIFPKIFSKNKKNPLLKYVDKNQVHRPFGHN